MRSYILLVLLISFAGSFLSAQSLRKLPISPKVNSPYDELAPVLSPDGNTLYFCREGDPANKGYKHRKNDQDIWVSQRNHKGEWQKAKQIDAIFNSEFYDFPIYASADNKTLYVGNVYVEDGSVLPGVSKVVKKGRSWGKPEALKIDDYYNNAALVNYSMGADERTLILNLERNDTYGKMDVYVSFLKNNGTWSAPRNLGPKVNSGYSEVTPFLAADMITLYFASNKPGGFGGFDMYLSRRLDDTWQNWSEPINLGENINTQGNDINYIIAASGEFAIVSSDTEESGKDLFIVDLPKELRPSNNYVFSGIVIDPKGKPLEANVLIEDLKTGKVLYNKKSDPVTGRVDFSLPVNEKYRLRTEKDGFLPSMDHVDLTSSKEYPAPNIPIQLQPVVKGATVKLSNIFFEYNSAKLSKDSFSELNYVKETLAAHPKMKIEIQGHTDNIGSTKSNKILSQKRAEAVRDYLLSKGVAANRITAKGFGASKPVTSNKTEQGRAKNRRVVFTVTAVD